MAYNGGERTHQHGFPGGSHDSHIKHDNNSETHIKNAVDYLKETLPRDKVMPGKKAWRNPTKQPKGFK